MSNNFPPDPDHSKPEKKSSQLLLLLLLVLVAVFAYLYFFTGLIKTRENQPKPLPAPEALVKKPLPPRVAQVGAQPAKLGTPSAAKTVETKAAAPAVPQAQPAKPVVPVKEATAQKPATGVAGAKDPQPAAPAAAAPQAKGAKPAALAGQAKGAHPAAAPEQQSKSAPAAGTKPAAKSAAHAKLAQKPAAKGKLASQKPAAEEESASSETEMPKASAKPGAFTYSLEITGDLLESEMGNVMAKLKRVGITQVVKTRLRKGEPMHRLFLADFASRDEALEELGRLKLAAPDAFMMTENGRYALYAGSYLHEGKAASEQDRLYAKGVQLLLKKATASVAVLKVRAGSFADQAGADKAARALKKARLPVKVVKVARARK